MTLHENCIVPIWHVELIESLVMTRSMHDTTDIYLQPKTECAKMHGLAIGIKLWLAVNDHASVAGSTWLGCQDELKQPI